MLASPSILTRGTTALSLADAKVLLELSSGTHPHDDMIEAMVASAQAYVEERTGRFLEAATGVLYIPEYVQQIEIPRSQIASVVVTYYDSDNVEQTIADTNYALVRHSVFTKLRFYDSYTAPSLYDRPDALTVTITFSADPVYPKLMMSALRMMVADQYENRENGVVRDIHGGSTGMNNRVDHLLAVARIWGH